METRLKPIVPNDKLVRFQAVTENDARIKQMFESTTSGQIKRMLGCALSHTDIWKLLRQSRHTKSTSPLQFSLVLEDDVFFRKDWIQVTYEFLTTINTIDPNWDMLQLNAQGFHSWDQGLKPAQGLLLSGGYILSDRGIDHLLELFEELTPNSAQVSSDYRLLRLQQRGHSYFYFPYLALQEFQESFISGWDDAQAQDHVLNLRNWQETTYRQSFGHLYDWYDG